MKCSMHWNNYKPKLIHKPKPKKPQSKDRGLGIGGAGGSRTPVRKYSTVGTTCLGPSLALATTVQDGHHTEQRAHYLFSDPV